MPTATGALRWLRLPRPKTFLGLMSLQAGTELISLALVFNKVTGVYGILAIFTGYALSALQLSMYIFSVLMVIALGFLLPHIRKQSPFQNLALAWLYVIDTLVNTAYTTAFAVNWYLASFHDPKGPAGAQDDAALSPSNGGDVPLDENQAAQANAGVGVQETAASMVLVVAFTLIRIYFSLVVMSYARMLLQRFVEEHSSTADEEHTSSGMSPNPFAVGSPLGEGWRGKVGRFMVSCGRGYWLGRKEDEEWAKDVSSKLRSNRSRAAVV
ncbi:Inositolphosphorylceramide synthase subunit Kei1-domain-containing protein [Diplogelasinospora grovesii]|uniref:Inositolphosphorylceramide synthase subunit Kei1-domain-containing protein n=1 Tax=Diplogelasinospora grovesii TaxID=303347 RepID=A0AAN6N6R3_9PEZI|nr:Inositolphosphorylceramide synthase subunit Kei1-domain-containing protein [Diplogelasinospora grovesii]